MSKPIEASTLADVQFSQLNYAYGMPVLKANLKLEPEYFIVEEMIDYSLSGEGEHLWCWVEKKGQNTEWVAGQLAQSVGISKRNVGYAGQKDRNAVTRQWFSLQLPGKEDPDLSSMKIAGVTILAMQRHNRKLQRGELAGNKFTLRLTSIQSVNKDEMFSVEQIKTLLTSRLQKIAIQGVPNYFGEQRFGHSMGNLVKGEALLKQPNTRESNKARRRKSSSNRNQQGMYISALRSWMFNVLLSKRIELQNWNSAILGDVLQLTKTETFVLGTTELLSELEPRIQTGELLPTGCLFGDGKLETQADALGIEAEVVKSYQAWCDALADRRVMQDRRALRLVAEDLSWSFSENEGTGLNLLLEFNLPAGSFATMLLREVLLTEDKGYKG